MRSKITIDIIKVLVLLSQSPVNGHSAAHQKVALCWRLHSFWVWLLGCVCKAKRGEEGPRS